MANKTLQCITISSDDENDFKPKIIDTVSLQGSKGKSLKKYDVFNQRTKPAVSNSNLNEKKRITPVTVPQTVSSIKKNPEESASTSVPVSHDNAELFKKFNNVCRKLGTNSRDTIKICKKVARAYSAANPEYTSSESCKTLLETSIQKILAASSDSSAKPWHFVKIVVDELKHNRLEKKRNKNSVTDSLGEGTSKVVAGCSKDGDEYERDETEILDPKTERQSKRLEKLLRCLDRKIRHLEAKEVELDDLDKEDSTYIMLDRYKSHFVKAYSKYCKLIKKTPDAERVYLRKISFAGSKYQEINKCLEKFYNKNRQFPDFQDVKKLVQNINVMKKMNWQPIEVHNIAEKTFKEFGEMLKRLRQSDEYQVMLSYLSDKDDPAKNDVELRQKLQENAKLGMKKEQEVIDTFVKKQTAEIDKSKDSDESGNTSEATYQDTDSEKEDFKVYKVYPDTTNDSVESFKDDFKSDEETIEDAKSSFTTYLKLKPSCGGCSSGGGIEQNNSSKGKIALPLDDERSEEECKSNQAKIFSNQSKENLSAHENEIENDKLSGKYSPKVEINENYNECKNKRKNMINNDNNMETDEKLINERNIFSDEARNKKENEPTKKQKRKIELSISDCSEYESDKSDTQIINTKNKSKKKYQSVSHTSSDNEISNKQKVSMKDRERIELYTDDSSDSETYHKQDIENISKKDNWKRKMKLPIDDVIECETESNTGKMNKKDERIRNKSSDDLSDINPENKVKHNNEKEYEQNDEFYKLSDKHLNKMSKELANKCQSPLVNICIYNKRNNSKKEIKLLTNDSSESETENNMGKINKKDKRKRTKNKLSDDCSDTTAGHKRRKLDDKKDGEQNDDFYKLSVKILNKNQTVQSGSTNQFKISNKNTKVLENEYQSCFSNKRYNSSKDKMSDDFITRLETEKVEVNKDSNDKNDTIVKELSTSKTKKHVGAINLEHKLCNSNVSSEENKPRVIKSEKNKVVYLKSSECKGKMSSKVETNKDKELKLFESSDDSSVEKEPKNIKKSDKSEAKDLNLSESSKIKSLPKIKTHSDVKKKLVNFNISDEKKSPLKRTEQNKDADLKIVESKSTKIMKLSTVKKNKVKDRKLFDYSDSSEEKELQNIKKCDRSKDMDLKLSDESSDSSKAKKNRGGEGKLLKFNNSSDEEEPLNIKVEKLPRIKENEDKELHLIEWSDDSDEKHEPIALEDSDEKEHIELEDSDYCVEENEDSDEGTPSKFIIKKSALQKKQKGSDKPFPQKYIIKNESEKERKSNNKGKKISEKDVKSKSKQSSNNERTINSGKEDKSTLNVNVNTVVTSENILEHGQDKTSRNVTEDKQIKLHNENSIQEIESNSSDTCSESDLREAAKLCRVDISDSEPEAVNIDDGSNDLSDSNAKKSTQIVLPTRRKKEPTPELCIIMESVPSKPPPPVSTFQEGPVKPIVRNLVASMPNRKPVANPLMMHSVNPLNRREVTRQPQANIRPVMRPSTVVHSNPLPVIKSIVSLNPSFSQRVGFNPLYASTPNKIRPQPQQKFNQNIPNEESAKLPRMTPQTRVSQSVMPNRVQAPQPSNSLQTNRIIANGVKRQRIVRRLQSNKVPPEEDVIVLD